MNEKVKHDTNCRVFENISKENSLSLETFINKDIEFCAHSERTSSDHVFQLLLSFVLTARGHAVIVRFSCY